MLGTPPRKELSPDRPKWKNPIRKGGRQITSWIHGFSRPGMPMPAIINAIYDAVGVRITELPVTPEKVLKALEEKDEG